MAMRSTLVALGVMALGCGTLGPVELESWDVQVSDSADPGAMPDMAGGKMTLTSGDLSLRLTTRLPAQGSDVWTTCVDLELGGALITACVRCEVGASPPVCGIAPQIPISGMTTAD